MVKIGMEKLLINSKMIAVASQIVLDNKTFIHREKCYASFSIPHQNLLL